MFISGHAQSYYDRDDQQTTRGLYLAIMELPGWHPEGKHLPPLGAVIRHTTFKPLGNWMMGSIRVKGHTIILSGPYGHDGLPLDWEQHSPDVVSAFIAGHLTDEETEAFWTGEGGHNSCGSEREAMHQVAKRLLAERTKR